MQCLFAAGSLATTNTISYILEILKSAHHQHSPAVKVARLLRQSACRNGTKAHCTSIAPWRYAHPEGQEPWDLKDCLSKLVSWHTFLSALSSTLVVVVKTPQGALFIHLFLQRTRERAKSSLTEKPLQFSDLPSTCRASESSSARGLESRHRCFQIFRFQKLPEP